MIGPAKGLKTTWICQRSTNRKYLMGLISRPSTQHVSRPKKQVQTTKSKQNLPDFPAIFVLMSQSKQECKEPKLDPEEVQELVLFSGPFYFPSPMCVNVSRARLYLIILISSTPQSFSAVSAFLLCSILAQRGGRERDKAFGGQGNYGGQWKQRKKDARELCQGSEQ